MTDAEEPAANVGRLTALVCVLVLVDTIFYTALTPLVPHYAHTSGLGKGGVGVLVAGYPAGTLVASIPAGVLYDRFGARRLLLVAMALMSVSTLTFGWSHIAVVLVLARFVQGIGGACAWTVGPATLAAVVPAGQRGRYLGIAFSAAVAGAIVGPAFGDLAAHLGTGPVFSAAAVLAVVITGFQRLLPPAGVPQAPSLRAFVDLARHADIARGMWLTLLAGVGLGMLSVLGPLRLNHLGASAGLIAAAFIASGLLEAGLSPWIGRLSDHHGSSYTVTQSLVLGIVTFALLPLVSPRGAALVAVALGSLAFGTLFIPAAALISDSSTARGLQLGLVFGLTNLLWATGQGLAAAVSGYAANATSDSVPFFAAVALCAVSLVSTRRDARRALT